MSQGKDGDWTFAGVMGGLFAVDSFFLLRFDDLMNFQHIIRLIIKIKCTDWQDLPVTSHNFCVEGLGFSLEFSPLSK